MSLHIIKMAPGLRALPELEAWFARGFSGPVAWISTKNRPKREAEILDGGSLYWVFGSQILGRQEILGFEDGMQGRCLFRVKNELVPVVPTPRKAFQGWRYLDGKDAPIDLPKARANEDALPAELAAHLAALGIL